MMVSMGFMFRTNLCVVCACVHACVCVCLMFTVVVSLYSMLMCTLCGSAIHPICNECMEV